VHGTDRILYCTVLYCTDLLYCTVHKAHLQGCSVTATVGLCEAVRGQQVLHGPTAGSKASVCRKETLSPAPPCNVAQRKGNNNNNKKKKKKKKNVRLEGKQGLTEIFCCNAEPTFCCNAGLARMKEAVIQLAMDRRGGSHACRWSSDPNLHLQQDASTGIVSNFRHLASPQKSSPSASSQRKVSRLNIVCG